jgi:hypothetical protein
MTDEIKVEKTAIQKAQKHFQSKLAGVLSKHHVAEWDLDVYYRGITTLKQEAKIVEYSSNGKSVEALVESILQKALTQEGKPLFSTHDKTALMNEADPVVVLGLARVLNGSDLPRVEDVEGN